MVALLLRRRDGRDGGGSGVGIGGVVCFEGLPAGLNGGGQLGEERALCYMYIRT